MALQSNTQIFIGGSPISAYKRLMLHQEIDAHHVLELLCRMDVLETIAGEIASESKNYLGEILTVKVSSLDTANGYKELEFKGIVTSVSNTKGFHQQSGDMVSIKAHSCSIITDDGPHYDSHSDVGLSEILDKTFQGYDKSKLETNISPQNSETLHYSVQHNESSFEYASRLAAQYSEWFFYDGSKLVFGKPEDKDTTELNYGHDLQEFSLNLNPTPNNFKYFTNDYLTDEQHEMATAQVNSGVNGFNGFTSEKSDAIFAKETSVYVNSYYDPQLKRRLDKHVEQQKKATEIRQVQIHGTSDNPGVNLGQVVKIKGEQADYGNFRIISVSHSSNENGKYQNRFVGVTADLDVYPNTNMMAFPKSESQVATVMDNADPEGMSRIKVQFPWQKASGEETPWLRVLTPHAGGGKGFQFTPEKDEEVIVGFEGGNAERPYVMGALFTGGSNAGDWKTEKNDIKAIKTRGGHTLSFSDEDGKETITITDKNGNSIILDTSKKEINISAPEKINFSSKEININASETVNIDGTNNVNVTSKEILNDGSAKVTVNSGAKVEIGAPSTLVEGKAELKLTSKGMTDIDGTAMTNVKGGLLNLNCG
ncbi:phage baseplate assembly protein V [uncultured Aquimarina sp.]|uniref:type VI secretion system Vgr family protein n=1 Tax=uncultured Aquimarina sp. TaxID=575652 RepID=UPI002615BF14|nr:phage baseplate assembly protein V [uncultured Aquimarina sp.]